MLLFFFYLSLIRTLPLPHSFSSRSLSLALSVIASLDAHTAFDIYLVLSYGVSNTMFPDIYAVYFTCAKLCLDFPFVSFAIALGMKERKTKKTRWKLRQMQKKKLKAARKSSKMSVGGGNNP